MELCLSCRRGFIDECISGCKPTEDTIEESSTSRFYKDDDKITKSAGRKRAAILYQINKDAPCEWRNLANCGGGKYPITGCFTGLQKHRHHGPVKNTARNERSNIHLICHGCHNLWHDKNDPHYDEKVYAELPHSPRPATLVELMERGSS